MRKSLTNLNFFALWTSFCVDASRLGLRDPGSDVSKALLANLVYRAGFGWVGRASFPLLSQAFAVFDAFGLLLDGYFLAFFRLNPSLFWPTRRQKS